MRLAVGVVLASLVATLEVVAGEYVGGGLPEETGTMQAVLEPTHIIDHVGRQRGPVTISLPQPFQLPTPFALPSFPIPNFANPLSGPVQGISSALGQLGSLLPQPKHSTNSPKHTSNQPKHTPQSSKAFNTGAPKNPGPPKPLGLPKGPGGPIKGPPGKGPGKQGKGKQDGVKCTEQEISCGFLRQKAYQMQNDDDECLKIATSFDSEGKIKFEPLGEDDGTVIYGITTDGLTASAWCNDIGWALRKIYNNCRKGTRCFGGDAYAARNSAFLVTVGPKLKGPRIPTE